MSDFEDFMGFSEADMEKAEQESAIRNLSAGTYNVMIESIAFMCCPAGVEVYAVDTPKQAGKNLRIEVSTVLTEETNGFPSGWKYKIFIKPYQEKMENFYRGLILKMFRAANVAPSNDMANALVGKIIQIRLEESTGKDGKKYTNIKDICQIGATNAAAPAKKAASNEPDWSNTKATTSTAKTAAKANAPSDWE